MTTEIIPMLAGYIASQILKQPQRSIAADEKLLSSGLIDSFHLVDLSIYIEEAFGVRIDDTELNADTFDTLEQLAEIIKQRQG